MLNVKYPNCGTYAGYRKHHNQQTKPCLECYAAARTYNKLRYSRVSGAPRQAKYRAENLDKVRAKERSKTRKRKAKIAIAYNESQVIAKYGTDCYLCGLAIDFKAPRKPGIKGWEQGLHIDHVLALSRGGYDMLENVRPTHGKCNLSKWAN